jgi:endogenous inhibitor of DNA gyrase (YacG/DUF329 family)
MNTDAINFFLEKCAYKYVLLIVFIGDKMSQDLLENVPEQEPQAKKNPLASWYRQPKIYVKLPSKGRFYTPGSLDVSSTEEYPVYAMTAKDELMFKTPDALLSGQSTVEVIKSCIPAILDPWAMPSIDLDFCLIAIRIATYGENMEVGSTCPYCSAKNDYDIDLNAWLQMFNNFTFQDHIEMNPLTIYIRPYTYRESTKTNIKTIEQQKIFDVINNENISDEEKLDRFGKSFVKLTELTVDIIADCITKIETPEGATADKAQIKDFINNTSKDVFDVISGHLQIIKNQIELKASDVKCAECEKEYTLPITMDQANFFAVRSQT